MTRRRRALEGLDQEIRDHIEQDTRDNIARGMAPEEARRKALRAFGNITLVKEDARAVWIPVWLEQIFQDARYGLRVLRKNPGFTAVAVAVIALGIGVNAAVFTLANAALFKGFAFVENDRMLYMRTLNTKTLDRSGVSWPDFEDWKTQAKSFDGMGAWNAVQIILNDKGGLLERSMAARITSNLFRLVGQKPILGRDFAPSDEMPGAASVAILTYSFWQNHYGKNPAVIGRTIWIDGMPTSVIGVMAQGFTFPDKQEVWVPFVPMSNSQKREVRDLDTNPYFVFGRMAKGVTAQTARAEMESIGRRLANSYAVEDQGFLPHTMNFSEAFNGGEMMMYRSMLGAVGFVLLIACANLANLMLARSIGRSREISIRIALGAGRWRIIRQLLIESVMLSATGGFIGCWIANWSIRPYALAAYPFGNPWFDTTIDYRVLEYLVAIILGTGTVFGLAPALRLSKLDINATLKDGGRGATGGGRGKHLSSLLVIGEVALAVMLLAGAGLMIRSVLNIYTANVGVKTANILTERLQLDSRYPRSEARISFYDRLRPRLEAIPGVESIAFANELPTQGYSFTLPYELAGASPVDEQRRPTISGLIISPAYFTTLGAEVLAGREFDDADGVSGVPVVIVNQRFVAKFWPGENPLGKHLRLFKGHTPEAWLTVVGVVSNIIQNDKTRQKFSPVIYLPYRQKAVGNMWVIARTRVPPGSLATAFRREIQAIDPDQLIFDAPLFHFRRFLSLAERLDSSYQFSRVVAVLLLIFAAIALLLASIGLYAVTAHSVSRRTQEIGIRMAMGATAGDILKPVLMQGMLPVGIGLAIGLAASFAVNRVLKAELVQVSPTDPITLVIASATLILSAALACLIPARRAMRVDPVIALRHE